MAKYALVMGLTEYHPDLPPLTRPAADARAVAEVLSTHGGYRITELVESADRGTVVAELKTFLQQTAAKQEALIYISGHSYLVQDDLADEQSGYIATSESRLRRAADDTITEQRQGIPFESLNKLIASADLSSLVLLLDTCHSGGLIDRGLFQASFNAFGAKTDYFFMTAARVEQQAWAKAGEPHSVFTSAVLSGLVAANAPEGGAITASGLYDHISRQLEREKQEAMHLGQGRSIKLVRYGVSQPEVLTISNENPYQGLKAFDEATARFFFGRERDIDRLLAKLEKTNFVPVIGVSGSGKSSVVRAGLIPALKQRGGWRILPPIKPGQNPMAMLKNAFGRLGQTSGDNNRVAERIEAQDLLGALDLLPIQQKLLLVVDQFEEVFALSSSPAEKQQFIDCITAVAQVPNSPLAIVTTMRADFLPDWLSYGELISSIQDDAVFLGRLEGQALQDAVEQPARVQGHEMEPGLVQLIQDDMAQATNALPLLEFALEALWDQRDTQQHRLTVAAYLDMQRLKGTLDTQATKLYETLDEREQNWCKRICLNLIRIGKEGQDTRKPQPRETLLALGQTERERELIADVIDRLVAGRLLVTDGDRQGQRRYVDIAHEALMDGWRLFAEWRQENRDLKRLCQRVVDVHEEWMDHGRSEDYLMRGGLLEELRGLSVIQRKQVFQQPVLYTFFTRSDEADQQQRAALEEALAKINVETRSRKIRDKLVDFPQQTVDAALEAIDNVGDSLEQLNGQVTHAAQYALNRAWHKIRERLRLEGHRDSVYAVSFSPDGERLVSGSDDATLRLWDLDGNPIGGPLAGHRDGVLSVSFSPDGERIVSGSDDAMLRLWDRDGNPIGAPLEGHRARVWSVSFSPDGERLVSGSDDATLRLWDRDGNPIGGPLAGHRDGVWSVSFSPDGERIVSGSADRTLRLWDRDGNPLGEPLAGHRARVLSVSFSPDGERIVSGSADRTLRLWDRIHWQDWLSGCCQKLLHHRDLVEPKTVVAQQACQTCLDYVWNRQERAQFFVAQGKVLAYYRQDLPGAIAKFEAALALDPQAIASEPQSLAQQLKAWGAKSAG